MAPFYAEQVDADTWRFTVDLRSPDHVTAKALTATGVVLIEKAANLAWKRVGGSAQCGGPSDVPSIELAVPGG
jgi:hypothetical protein